MRTDDILDILGEDEITTGDTIHESDLADLLGITANRIRTLARDGILKRTGRATFDRREAVRSYCANLRDKATRAGRPAAAESDALKIEKLRLAKEQADKIALENARKRGEMLPALAVEREWAGILRDVRSSLLAAPSRVGAKLPHLTAHDVAEFDREIRSALERLADD